MLYKYIHNNITLSLIFIDVTVSNVKVRYRKEENCYAQVSFFFQIVQLKKWSKRYDVFDCSSN